MSTTKMILYKDFYIRFPRFHWITQSTTGNSILFQLFFASFVFSLKLSWLYGIGKLVNDIIFFSNFNNVKLNRVLHFREFFSFNVSSARITTIHFLKTNLLNPLVWYKRANVFLISNFNKSNQIYTECCRGKSINLSRYIFINLTHCRLFIP